MRQAVGSITGNAFDFATSEVPHANLLSGLFGSVTSKAIDTPGKTITQTINLPKNVKPPQLIWDHSAVGIYYSDLNGIVTITADNPGALTLNGVALSGLGTINRTVLYREALSPNITHYISINGQLTELVPGTTNAKIDDTSPGQEIDVMTPSSTNLVTNGSFETGLWQDKVSDCNNYDASPKISMDADKTTATDGQTSLKLTATRHVACTTTDVPLSENTAYAISYDYQGENATLASHYLSFNNSLTNVSKGFQAISDSNWHHVSKQFSTPAGTTLGTLDLYALEDSTSATTVTNRYDKVRISQLSTSKVLNAPSQPAAASRINLPTQSAGTPMQFAYSDPTIDYKNLITNGSFEAGPWRKTVSDCGNSDSNANIKMKINNQASTNGKSSLELSATRHVACTYTSTEVKAGKTYLLDFDYQGDGHSSYGYYVGFDDPDQTSATEQTLVKDKTWHNFTREIKVPAGASTLTLYLYSFESDGNATNVMRYDNVHIYELPSVVGQYYLLATPTQPVIAPQITYVKNSQSVREVKVKGATTGFYVALSETYHPSWRLEMNNQKLQGFGRVLPWLSPDVVSSSNHFEMNKYSNGWYVDVDKLCKQQNLCTKNPDGSYNLEMVAEFTPQRWFYMGLGISGVTLLACIGFLANVGTRSLVRRRRVKKSSKV